MFGRMVFNRTIALSLVITATFLIALQVDVASACTPPERTPWFSENLRVSEEELPQGISFEESERGRLILHNDSDSRLILQTPSSDLAIARKGSIELSVFGPGLFAGPKMISEVRSEYRIGDNRPDDVEIPSPQMVQIGLTRNEADHVIFLEISYTLNEGYRPGSVAAAEKACRGLRGWGMAGLPVVMAFLCLIFASVGIGLAIWAKARGSRNFQN